MILHIAQFTWKPEVTEEEVVALTVALTRMAEQIPAIRSYVAGSNLRLRPSPSDYAVAAIVDDAEGLAAYLDHPLHAAVYAEHLGRMIAERSAAQLPIEAGTLS
jgi:hypothetical protein